MRGRYWVASPLDALPVRNPRYRRNQKRATRSWPSLSRITSSLQLPTHDGSVFSTLEIRHSRGWRSLQGAHGAFGLPFGESAEPEQVGGIPGVRSEIVLPGEDVLGERDCIHRCLKREDEDQLGFRIIAVPDSITHLVLAAERQVPIDCDDLARAAGERHPAASKRALAAPRPNVDDELSPYCYLAVSTLPESGH